MAQNITLNIAGRVYGLTAQTPEQEHDMRVASEEVNNLVAQSNQAYPGMDKADKMSFVAFNINVNKVMVRNAYESFQREVSKLDSELESYLKNIEK